MSAQLAELLDLLVSQDLITPATAVDVAKSGPPNDVDGPIVEGVEIINDPGAPALWWMSGLDETQGWFSIWLDEIGGTQIDDGLIDRIAPALADHGIDLTHDWHGGEPHPEGRPRIWINGITCDYDDPTQLGCMQPLVIANQLLAGAGSEHRFYFCGRQWYEDSFVPEVVIIALLPITVALALQTTEHLVDAARPFLVDDVLHSGPLR